MFVGQEKGKQKTQCTPRINAQRSKRATIPATTVTGIAICRFSVYHAYVWWDSEKDGGACTGSGEGV